MPDVQLDRAPGQYEQQNRVVECAVDPGQPATRSYWSRLWPLALHLYFTIGYIQFSGLTLALLYPLCFDHNDASYTTGAWVGTIGYCASFPVSVFGTCYVCGLIIARDRAAREESSTPWIRCKDEQGHHFYYNLESEKSSWQRPRSFDTASKLHPITWEVNL